MLLIGMVFELHCDACDFASTTEEEWRAHDQARQHEGDHPTHFVVMDRGE